MKTICLSLVGLLIGFLMTWLIYPLNKMDDKNLTNVLYCSVDSLSTIKKYDVTPETTNKYWTNCGQVFFSKKEYKKGDTVQFKIIVIE